MTNTIMFFAPHPDDAEWYAGGTLAKFARQGDRVIIVTVTDGGAGSFELSRDELVRLRAAEAGAAAQVLGALPPIFIGYPDQGLDQLPAGALRKQFIRLLRTHRPDVVFAEDVLAKGEVHPDHRAVAQAASDALNFATLPLVYPEHLKAGLETHFVKEKYYYGGPADLINKIIDVSETMPIKLAALAEHKTQMRFLVEDILRQAAAAGLDARHTAGPMVDDPTMAVGWALQTEAAQVGAKIGVQFAEAFRYTRFHPFIESLLESKPGREE